MKIGLLRTTVLLVLAIFVAGNSASAQTGPSPFEREFDHPIDDLKQALQALHADDTTKLPTVHGFVSDNLAIGIYERPYYQFETELVSRNADRTLLRVRARVTAWHTDSAGGSPEYRSLTSNGRLESELLDRVNSYLIKIDSDLVSRINMLEKMLGNLTDKTDVLEKRREELTAQNERLEGALKSQVGQRNERTVLRAGTRILDRPATGAHSILTAERDDMFEVAAERPGWVGVKLEGGTTGWLPSNEIKAVPELTNQTALSAALKEKQKPFVVTRETVTQFLGDWPSLRGQKALFLWAQPVGVANREATEKLSYVKQVFADRYRDAVHSDVSYSGLVIIFLGPADKSGVAAARLDDIGQWLDGHMADNEFLKRCSLDPPSVFRSTRR